MGGKVTSAKKLLSNFLQKRRICYISRNGIFNLHTCIALTQIAPLRLTPDSEKLLANSGLLRLSAELSEVYASKEKLVTDQFLQVIGTMLWKSLDADDVLRQAKRQAGQSVLPVVIESDDPAVHQLPWETLWHPEFGFLGQQEGFTLSRSIPSNGAWLPPFEPGPLRILLFTSLPDDLTEQDQLQIENEQAGVLEALGPWLRSGHVALEMPDDGRFTLFEERLQSFKPHLVWLSGHGVFRKNLLDGGGKGFFLFENEHGFGEEVDETTLAGAFSDTAVQALILSACQSGQSVSSDLNNGLMYALAQRGIPHVVGMRESIFDRAGVQFARGFFEALLKKQGVAEALQQARREIVQPLRGDDEARRYKLADLSFGQWRLPMLLSRDASRPLIRWDFTPQPMREKNIRNRTLKEVSLPERFIGRRRELRVLQKSLREGSTRTLLITGAGGMGKTALAGKLILDLQQDGYEVFVFSAISDKDWKKSIVQMTRSLNRDNAEQYSSEFQEGDTENNAASLFELLLVQYRGKVAVLFDNLESVQEPTSRTLTDAVLKIWIDAACALQDDGLRVVLTSRWALPEWNEPLLPLGTPVWRDFLVVAQQQNLSADFLRDSAKLRQAFEVLGGNFRALLYLTDALKTMTAVEEQAFLEKLKQAEADIQTNMLLDRVWQHRSADEQELLRRMRAYTVPVAPEGVKAIALPDLPQAEALLDELLAVSLVERYHNLQWKTDEYLASPLVRSWLEKQGVEKPEPELLQKAAGYHRRLLEHERRTPEQAMTVHAALMAAGENDEAHRIALDRVVGLMNMAGLYRSVLDNWLIPACTSADPWILSEALGQTGKQYLHLADYDTALDYLKRSLKIRQEIGDKSGLCYTLFNMGHIHLQNEDVQNAVSSWVTVYRISRAINLAEVLKALASLAGQLGLPGGLDGWEHLSRQMEENEGGEEA
jgi:tetratricopeptide (TPR) repeat protein